MTNKKEIEARQQEQEKADTSMLLEEKMLC